MKYLDQGFVCGFKLRKDETVLDTSSENFDHFKDIDLFPTLNGSYLVLKGLNTLYLALTLKPDLFRYVELLPGGLKLGTESLLTNHLLEDSLFAKEQVNIAGW